MTHPRPAFAQNSEIINMLPLRRLWTGVSVTSVNVVEIAM
jgi:hypothetical protein